MTKPVSNHSVKQKTITSDILGAFFFVYNELGYGFLEKIYENSLSIELQHRGMNLIQQQPVQVCYKGWTVGAFYADLIVNHTIVIEVKAADLIMPAHEAQLLNYLRATKFEIGLLLNFGRSPEFRRKIFTNDRKRSGTEHGLPQIVERNTDEHR